MTTLKISYVGASAFTWTTLGTLATDSTQLVGCHSIAIDNTSTLADDVLVEGIITTTTAATINTVIEIWCYASIDNATTYSAAVVGTTDATQTLGSMGIKNLMALVTTIQQTDTAAHTYNWGPVSLANLFGGSMPDHYGLWATQNTGQVIASASAKYNPIVFTNA